ncbi:MAG: TIGR04283 family arsenosugar biosynthesis glycosyltransferase [Hyphomicrobiaceae bacterium]
MISVIIPTLNAEQDLAGTLSALVPAVIEGLVREVIIVDGGSTDQTLKIADQSGGIILKTAANRGAQLKMGAKAAKFQWLLFLHADTVLSPGWEAEVASFIEKIESGRRAPQAAAFRFALDDDGFAPWVVEKFVGFRSSLLGLPYGDQGLLISRQLYGELGEHKELPLMEDVDIVRRIGRRRISVLRSQAITSAVRYRDEGYTKRIARNQTCLVMYFMKTPLSRIANFYRSQSAD